MIIRIATRQSQLALWQANFVRARLGEAHPDLTVELVGMKTQGDRWLTRPLSEVGGKGLFVKELEAALLDGRADIAVHSIKDLPAELPEGFALPVVGYRELVNDVLVGVSSLAGLQEGARVGSSSLRRKAQLLAARPDLDVQPIRGNVDTRLAKLDAGEFDAIVLAAAGLKRLQIERADAALLATELSLPAPGQGALGIETLAKSAVVELLAPLVDEDAARCVAAERGISSGLGADCSLPIAALASIEGDAVALEARLLAEDGSRMLRARAVDRDPAAAAREAVAELHAQGAAELLRELKR